LKTALSVVALALCIPTASATAQDSGVRFGVLGGISYAKITFDPEPEDFELERLTGPAGGLTIEFPLSDNVLIDTRALYVRKGAKLTSSEFGDAEFRIQIDYVSVPVLLKLKGGGSVRPYVGVGPEVAFKVNAKTKLTVGELSEEEDIDEDVKSTDFGIAAAAGLEFGEGVAVFLEAGYVYGLTSIDENPLADVADAKNQTFLFMAGVRF
jgi:opacity protein-like surface antigen